MAIASKQGKVRGTALAWVMVAATAFVAAPARGRERADGTRAELSNCGGHTLKLARGALHVDGRRVSPPGRGVGVLGRPTCRGDGRAVAWIERGDGETRLLVLPELEGRAAALPWPLPFVANDDRVFWAARTRVVVGPTVFAPRAVASWTESLR